MVNVRQSMLVTISAGNTLTLSTLGKSFSRRHIKLFSYFAQKSGFDISMETICMNYQILISGENKKSIINLSSGVLAQRVVKFKSNCMVKQAGLGKQFANV